MSESKTEPSVLTPFGGLEMRDARALAAVLDSDGVTVLRDLIAARNRMALERLRRADFPADKAMFERGVMDALQSIHEILLELPESISEAYGSEEPHGEDTGRERSREPQRGGGGDDDRGPE